MKKIFRRRAALLLALILCAMQFFSFAASAGETADETQTQEETGENPEETPQEAPKPAFFLVTVSDRETDPLVTITTKIRAVEPPAETVPDEGDNAKAPDGQGGAK